MLSIYLEPEPLLPRLESEEQTWRHLQRRQTQARDPERLPGYVVKWMSQARR